MNPNFFENTQIAFALKSDSELERAYFLFKMIASEPLVRIGTAVTNFAIKAHLPVDGLIRATVFDHFCGGTTEKDCMPVADKMFQAGVCSVLDYSVEGKEEESQFKLALDKTLSLLDFVEEKKSIPFAVFKPTGFGRMALYEKVGRGESLSPAETQEWAKVQDRFEKAAQKAFDRDLCLLVDAEESWMQDAADALVEEMMRKFNKKRVIVYNTLQLYRWDRIPYLEGLLQRAEKEGFYVGIKLVRGAYMEKENERASERGYPTPICKDKKTTDKNFDSCLTFIMEHLDRMALFIGSHNEESTYHAIHLLEDKGIAKNDTRIWFGQLYGMSDHISFNLAKEGYNVAKYLPFGPVRDVMPYLIRRAEENTSVAGQTTRELELLKKERFRRKL